MDLVDRIYCNFKWTMRFDKVIRFKSINLPFVLVRSPWAVQNFCELDIIESLLCWVDFGKRKHNNILNQCGKYVLADPRFIGTAKVYFLLLLSLSKINSPVCGRYLLSNIRIVFLWIYFVNFLILLRLSFTYNLT